MIKENISESKENTEQQPNLEKAEDKNSSLKEASGVPKFDD